MTDVEHLEQIVARGLTAIMAATPVGESLPTEPYADAFTALEIADARSISSLRLRLGEPGPGQLGVSGPPCTSTAASTLRMMLPDRETSIGWVYEAGW